MTSSINFPCKVCGKNVNDNDRAIQCELGNYWIHTNYNNNNNNYIDYKFLQNSNDSWYCILCCSQIFPFNSMKSNKNFSICTGNFYNNNKPGKTNIEGSLLLKPAENLKLLVNQFNNNASPEDNTDPENVVQSKYYDIDELQTMKIPNKDKSLVLFHINACSLYKNFNELEHLLSCTYKNFDVIAISETKITKNISLTNNLTMNNFSFEFTSTESSAGGTLLYVANHLSYKPYLDLNVCKSNELESNFIEILNPKKLILLSVLSINILQWILMILTLII